MKASLVRIGVIVAFVGLVAGGFILGGVGPAEATRADISLNGIWRSGMSGAPWRLVQIRGGFESGFAISAGEPFDCCGFNVKCTFPVGQLLERWTPVGPTEQNGSYLRFKPYEVEHFTFELKDGSCTTRQSGRGSTKVSLYRPPGRPVQLTAGVGYTRVGPLPTTARPEAPAKPPAKPPEPPTAPTGGKGWLEIAVALEPARTTSSARFRVCVKAVTGGATLCYFLRGGEAREVVNHGKRMQWAVGTKVQACENRYAGWSTPPGCRVVTIREGANRVTFTNRRDETPPEVKALSPSGVARPGTREPLQFTLWDDSGAARVHARLYEGGTIVAESTTGWLQADGGRQAWTPILAADLVGPLYFCVWAGDRADNWSQDSAVKPEEFQDTRGSCAWISLVTPIEKVSNGCGGAGWDVFVWAQNYFGNEHTYSNSNVNPLAASYTVSFVEACNLHDAGYGGRTVRDVINGGTVDYRPFSRPQVDDKFLRDMRTLCDRAIPASAKTARKNCKAKGGNVAVGAQMLFDFVDGQGWRFFDADLTKPDSQRHGHRCQYRPC